MINLRVLPANYYNSNYITTYMVNNVNVKYGAALLYIVTRNHDEWGFTIRAITQYTGRGAFIDDRITVSKYSVKFGIFQSSLLIDQSCMSQIKTRPCFAVNMLHY